MGRLASKPIAIPDNVTVSMEKGILKVVGPKGELQRDMPAEIAVNVDATAREIMCSVSKPTKRAASLLGTAYVHTRNMMQGVSEGYVKILELEGVGYRASAEGNNLVLSLGFSHPVKLTLPEGVELKVEKNEIRIMGTNKELVGQTAATIRAYKEPEPYKGKGIHYRGEYIPRKAGKKAGAA